MPLTNGRYVDLPRLTRPQRVVFRLRWLRGRVRGFVWYPPWRRHPEDTGGGHTINREWGAWIVRPVSGWRSWRWITPPSHATRSVARADRDAACFWALDVLGIHPPAPETR
jgi:hypothetical protein